MKNLILTPLFCLCTIFLFAQEKETTTLKFLNINEVGILPAIGENSSGIATRINTVLGIQVDDVFSVGLATGVKFVSIGAGEKYVYPHIPIALDFRVLMSKGKYVPFLYTQAGYAFTTYAGAPRGFPFDNVWGGVVFGGGLGYRYQINEKWGINLSMGYQAQQNHFKPPTVSAFTHQLAVGLGVNFLGDNRLK